VASCVLATLGELATVGGEDMGPHIPQLLPLIIETLQDQSSVVKREIALRTLGQLAESAGAACSGHSISCAIAMPSHLSSQFNSGCVVEPFLKYPNLLDILINEIKTEQGPSIRLEVVKVLGIIGALDPYRHKIVQTEVRTDKSEDPSSSNLSNQLPTDSLAGLGSEEYYLTVSVHALMKILRDTSLSQVPDFRLSCPWV